MKKWRAFKKITRYFGLAGLPAACKQLFSAEESLECVDSRHVGHPIYFRLNTTDASIYWQIFINNEYDLPAKLQPKLIVDAGPMSATRPSTLPGNSPRPASSPSSRSPRISRCC